MYYFLRTHIELLVGLNNIGQHSVLRTPRHLVVASGLVERLQDLLKATLTAGLRVEAALPTTSGFAEVTLFCSRMSIVC